MNEQIKQRLVGAVVLVSLAVIFIPMLLDGGNDSTMPRFGSNIPDKSDINFEPLEIPLKPQEPAAQRPRVIEKAETPAKTPEPPKSDVPEKTTSAQKPAVEKPKVEAAKESAPASNDSPTGDEPVAWVVQVGSFGQSDNALALRDKLRKKGFTAFVEKYSDKGKTSYRVRVGPELKRSTAEEHLKQLQEKLQIKGLIMGHP